MLVQSHVFFLPETCRLEEKRATSKAGPADAINLPPTPRKDREVYWINPDWALDRTLDPPVVSRGVSWRVQGM